MRVHHFIAANRHEGCGHRHRSPGAAVRCLARIDPEHGRPAIYRITAEHRDRRLVLRYKRLRPGEHQG